MQVAIVLSAVAALAAGGAAAQDTVSPQPAHENAYGVTTGSPLSSSAPAPTRGSAMSTARLPKPASATQRARPQPRRPSRAGADPGGVADRATSPTGVNGPGQARP